MCIPDEWLSTTEPGLSVGFHLLIRLLPALLLAVCHVFRHPEITVCTISSVLLVYPAITTKKQVLFY